MKKNGLFYICLSAIVILVICFIIYLFFSPEQYWKAFLLALFPAAIVAVSFRLFTNYRIKLIYNQLLQIFKTLEEFDVDEPSKVSFEESPFPIFNELNAYLVGLIDRVRKNYKSNKQFTENASHELQTPLAVIKGHIEILLQSPNIGEKEIESLGILLQNTNRLSKINTALILLSKIEHRQFGDFEKVSFLEIAEEALLNFHDLISSQSIEIKKEVETDFEVEMSKTLSEILFNNLLQNAIRYNTENGFIKIKLKKESVVIENPSKELDIENAKVLFRRFHRISEVEESLGLGLSIVQRICEESNLDIEYKIENNLHSIQIKKLKNNLDANNF